MKNACVPRAHTLHACYACYNMLNNVIQDKTGTAQITLVYNDKLTAGGSWITGRFDVADMEKLDANKIIFLVMRLLPMNSMSNCRKIN